MHMCVCPHTFLTLEGGGSLAMWPLVFTVSNTIQRPPCRPCLGSLPALQGSVHSKDFMRRPAWEESLPSRACPTHYKEQMRTNVCLHHTLYKVMYIDFISFSSNSPPQKTKVREVKWLPWVHEAWCDQNQDLVKSISRSSFPLYRLTLLNDADCLSCWFQFSITFLSDQTCPIMISLESLLTGSPA